MQNVFATDRYRIDGPLGRAQSTRYDSPPASARVSGHPWLVAVAGRTEFRSRIGELLLASGGPYGGAYCISLATFGTSADADLVCRYLDRYLPQPDLVYDQTFALSTLLHLDAVLGTERASSYLAAGNLWQQWTDATPNMVRDPHEYQQVVNQLCSFAGECAELTKGSAP